MKFGAFPNIEISTAMGDSLTNSERPTASNSRALNSTHERLVS